MCGAFSGFLFPPFPTLPHPSLSTVYQCDGCLSYLGRGGSWLGCQVWPAISAVSILELVANSGSSRMSRAPNLHSLRATKLFKDGYRKAKQQKLENVGCKTGTFRKEWKLLVLR